MSDESCRPEIKKGFLSVSVSHKGIHTHIKCTLSYEVVNLQAVVEFAKAILKAVH